MRSFSSLRHAIAIAALSVTAALSTASRAAEPASAPAGSGSAAAGAATSNSGDAYRGYQSDYPATEVQAVPGARADATRARLEYDLSRTRLCRYIDRSWDDFYNSKEFLDASAAESRAQASFDRERDRVVRSLMKDTNYQALTQLVRDMHAKLEQEHPKDKQPSASEFERLVAVASVKMGYSSTASAMEAAALSADAGVQDARSRLVDAGNRKAELRRNYDHSVRRGPEFAAAQDMMDQLRINKLVSAEYLAGLYDSRTIALNYAAFLHGWDQYRYLSGSGYGYGVGYGAGYGYPSYNSFPYVSGGVGYNGGFARRY